MSSLIESSEARNVVLWNMDKLRNEWTNLSPEARADRIKYNIQMIASLEEPADRRACLVELKAVTGYPIQTLEEQLALERKLADPPPASDQPKTENQTDDLPYRETPAGIVWDKPAQEGSVVEKPLTNFTARIISDVSRDDGAEITRAFEIEARMNGQPFRFLIPASHFAGMNWVMEHMGAGALVFAGFGTKDHARAAIQMLSSQIHPRQIYTHTGWRKIGSVWAYLHAGGAIGPEGTLEGVEVSLEDPISRFLLPDPPQAEELKSSIRASLRLLSLEPDPISFSTLSAVYRSAIEPADFSLHFAGRTGAGKTALGAVAQQHFGAVMDERNLPGSWSSTGNAIEGLAFLAKEALLVVDDFAPVGSLMDVQRMHREADRVFRMQGNRSSRMRMRPDATLKPNKPPRGLILSTGEDVPKGQSARARVLILELKEEELDWNLLTQCQQEASAGVYAQAMAGFVQWLARGREEKLKNFREEVLRLRAEALLSSSHKRTPHILANLFVAFRYLLAFAEEKGALTPEEATALSERCWKALGITAEEQLHHQETAKPARRFLELLSAAIASGRAHVADTEGRVPENPQAWGWREHLVGSGENAHEEWLPQGERVGWMEGLDLYLVDDAAYAVAQRLGRDSGESLSVSLHRLKKEMEEQNLLVTTESSRRTRTIRRMLEGARRYVLHLRSDIFESLSSPEVAQLAQGAQKGLAGQDSCPPGQVAGQLSQTELPTGTQGQGIGSEKMGKLGDFLKDEREPSFNRPGEWASRSEKVAQEAPKAAPEPAAPAQKSTSLYRCATCRHDRFWVTPEGRVIKCAKCNPPPPGATWWEGPKESIR